MKASGDLSLPAELDTRLSEIMDLRKEKHFFETRVTEYQTGGALGRYLKKN